MEKSKYDVEIVNKRRSGNSTRQMDSYIQQLFDEEEVRVIDHSNINNEHPDMDIWLIDKIIRRIGFEHPRAIVKRKRNTNILQLLANDEMT